MLGQNFEADKLASYFATWLATVSMKAAEMLNGGGRPEDTEQTAEEQAPQQAEQAPGRGAQSGFTRVDSVPNYEQNMLSDGRLVKHYEDGSVRLENPHSGVIQEERANGNLLVSLPDGKLLFQEFPSDPLLLYDLNNSNKPPLLAGVGVVTLPGDEYEKPAYNFRDEDGVHLVDVESLRYFRIQENAPHSIAQLMGRAS